MTVRLRQALLYGSASVLFLVLAISLTPITSPLPPYTGNYEVGILDVETEVEKRIIHDALIKETGEKAFELQTLAITLYYPSALSPLASKPWARPWLPQPISLIGTGYARLLRIYSTPLQSVITFVLWALGSKTVIPGVVNAPVLSPINATHNDAGSGKVVTKVGMGGKVKAEGDAAEILELRDDGMEHDVGLRLKTGMGKLPAVVFTHGMAGMSQSYSHYLGSIASHGYVVAAVEHRDGSGPGTIVHYSDGGERPVWHLSLDDLESSPPMNESDIKTAQLNFREAEMQETIQLFKRMNRGTEIRNLKPNSPQSAIAGFKDRFDMSAITIAGHSYGATGALQALKNAPNDDMPINGAIALDPGKGSGPLNDDIDLPTLVIQSGEWTEKQVEFYGQGWHFDVVRKLVAKATTGWFMTLGGSAHPSCTDAPLIVPWIMRLATGTTLNGKTALREYIDTSVHFLEYLRNGDKEGLLKSDVSSPAGPLGDAAKREKVKGGTGADWEVHVTPED